MRSPRVVGVALALSLAACGGDSTLEIWLSALPAEIPGSTEFVLQYPGGGRTLANGDFSPGPQSTALRAGPVKVPDSGQLAVTASYMDADGRLFRARVTWELREKFEWSLGLWRMADDPTETCMGCRSVWPFPQIEGPPSLGDSYWLVMGGDERGSDVVY